MKWLLFLFPLILHAQVNLRDPAFIARIKSSASAPTLPYTNGLVQWFKADTITNLVDGSRVVLWSDSSPPGGKNFLSTGGAGTDPLYKISAQNGLPGVDFDGVDDVLTHTASIVTPSNTVSMFLLFRQRAISTAAGAYQVGSATGGQTFFNDSGTRSIVHRAVAVLDDGACATNLELWVSVRTAAPLQKMWINTTNVTISNSTSGENTPDAGAALGSFAGTFMNCQIYEGLLYDRPLADADRQSVENYLIAKWGGGGP